MSTAPIVDSKHPLHWMEAGTNPNHKSPACRKVWLDRGRNRLIATTGQYLIAIDDVTQEESSVGAALGENDTLHAFFGLVQVWIDPSEETKKVGAEEFIGWTINFNGQKSEHSKLGSVLGVIIDRYLLVKIVERLEGDEWTVWVDEGGKLMLRGGRFSAVLQADKYSGPPEDLDVFDAFLVEPEATEADSPLSLFDSLDMGDDSTAPTSEEVPNGELALDEAPEPTTDEPDPELGENPFDDPSGEEPDQSDQAKSEKDYLYEERMDRFSEGTGKPRGSSKRPKSVELILREWEAGTLPTGRPPGAWDIWVRIIGAENDATEEEMVFVSKKGRRKKNRELALMVIGGDWPEDKTGQRPPKSKTEPQGETNDAATPEEEVPDTAAGLSGEPEETSEAAVVENEAGTTEVPDHEEDPEAEEPSAFQVNVHMRIDFNFELMQEFFYWLLWQGHITPSVARKVMNTASDQLRIRNGAEDALHDAAVIDEDFRNWIGLLFGRFMSKPQDEGSTWNVVKPPPSKE